MTTLITVETAKGMIDDLTAENASLRSQVERLEEQLQDEAQGGIDEQAARRDCDDSILANLEKLSAGMDEVNRVWQQHLDELGAAQQRVKELEDTFKAMVHQARRHKAATGDGSMLAFAEGWARMANVTEGN